MKSIQVLIADGDGHFRTKLQRACGLDRRLEVVGVAADGRAAVALARRLLPHVVLIDSGLQGLDSPQVTRRIMQHNPAVRVIVLASYRDRALALEALRVGAWGYLLKDIDAEAMLETVCAAYQGAAPLDARLVERVLSAFQALGALV